VLQLVTDERNYLIHVAAKHDLDTDVPDRRGGCHEVRLPGGHQAID
jgi:hypothetical protein